MYRSENSVALSLGQPLYRQLMTLAPNIRGHKAKTTLSAVPPI